MRSLLIFTLTILLFVPVRGGDIAAIKQDPELKSTVGLLDSWIASQVEYQQLPGLSIAVLYGNDLVWSRAYGLADLQKKAPMTTESVFRIASITKTFTCTAIMQLRDRGSCASTIPFSSICPGSPTKQAPGRTAANIADSDDPHCRTPRRSGLPVLDGPQVPDPRADDRGAEGAGEHLRGRHPVPLLQPGAGDPWRSCCGGVRGAGSGVHSETHPGSARDEEHERDTDRGSAETTGDPVREESCPTGAVR